MRGLPAVRGVLSHPRFEDREKPLHPAGERQLVLRCRGGDLEAGRHRRRAAVLHGQPQGAAGLLGPPASQRLPGHEPAHRPAAGADGDPGVSGQEAGAHPARRSGAADHGADAAAGAIHAGAVLRHELRLHQLQRPRESGQSGGGAGDLLQHRRGRPPRGPLPLWGQHHHPGGVRTVWRSRELPDGWRGH